MHNQRTVTLVPLTPSQVYEDQVRLQKDSEQKKKSEKESEQKKKSEKESEQKKKLEKESEQKKESAKMQVTQNLKERERKTNFYARASEVKKALFLNKPMIVLLYKEALFNTNQLFFFFWIIKNLFPKGQYPNKQLKNSTKPKAHREYENRTAPPLKHKGRGNSPQQNHQSGTITRNHHSSQHKTSNKGQNNPGTTKQIKTAHIPGTGPP